jgi:diguanylate cyclase (GGDEF)-like protein
MSWNWKTKSLRFWLSLGLALAVLPLAASALASHYLLGHGVVDAFADVAARQRYQLVPSLRLRAALLDAVEPLDEFVDDGDPQQAAAYRVLREQVETGFSDLQGRLSSDPEPFRLESRAREDWTSADRVATETFGIRHVRGDRLAVERMERFHALIGAAVDKLGALSKDIEADVVGDHDEALLFYERAEWLTAIAGGISFLAMLAAVITIGRIVSQSVDRLVAGAERFAAGDRLHRIDVQVPPELHSVAEEFNRMIGRVHESEAALAELARLDGLTKLPNRRAFDRALDAVVERLRLIGEPAALVVLDVDHFKKVNDTFGHGAGDDVLRRVARVLEAAGRGADQVFRTGGEEFAILLPAEGEGSAAAKAERVRQLIAEETITIGGKPIHITASFGVAVATGVCDPARLTETADRALYDAKAQGRNRVIVRPLTASAP